MLKFYYYLKSHLIALKTGQTYHKGRQSADVQDNEDSKEKKLQLKCMIMEVFPIFLFRHTFEKLCISNP